MNDAETIAALRAELERERKRADEYKEAAAHDRESNDRTLTVMEKIGSAIGASPGSILDTARRLRAERDALAEKLAAAERTASVTGAVTSCVNCELRQVEIARLRTQLREVTARITTIADEANGPHPVQSADDSLTEIEHALWRLRQWHDKEEKRADAAESQLASSQAACAAAKKALSHALSLPHPPYYEPSNASYRWHTKPHARPCVGCDMEDALAADAGSDLLADLRRMRERVSELEQQLKERD